MISPKAALMIVITGLFSLGILAYALRWVWVAILAIALLFKAYPALSDDSKPPTPEQQAYMLSWIPAACCVTSGTCCREIQERDLTPLPGNNFLIKESDQIKLRTGPSPDTKFYRCSCEYAGNNLWRWTPKGNTRCLFTPEMSY